MSPNVGGRPIRLLYLTEWFDPEPVMKGLRFAQGLKQRGVKVEVATAFPNHPGGTVYDGYRLKLYQREQMEGIPLHRLYVYPSHDRSGLRRMATYASFFLSSLMFCLARLRRYDLVYVYHPPIMPAFAAALAGVIHRKPFILEIQDLWPDSVASSGMGRPWIVGLLNAVCNFTYRRAAVIVCQSDGIVKRLTLRGVPARKLVRIYNWSNYVPAELDTSGTMMPATIEDSFAGRLNVVYGGNIGQAQGLKTVVSAAAIAAQKIPSLRVHLIGSGIDRDVLAKAIAAGATGEVLLHDPISAREMDRVFDRADALVMHLKDDPLYDITVPSKTQHYLSVGRPIIAGVSGEAKRILLASGAARVVPSNDVGAMATAIAATASASLEEREAAGKRGREYYHSHLGFEAAMERTVSVLQAVRG